MSQAYGIADAAEAEAYLRDPVLGPRLVAIAVAVDQQVRSGASLEQVLGSEIDVLKLVSSLTLFGSLASNVAAVGLAHAGELARVADDLLQAARAEGHRPCEFTLARLRASR